MARFNFMRGLLLIAGLLALTACQATTSMIGVGPTQQVAERPPEVDLRAATDRPLRPDLEISGNTTGNCRQMTVTARGQSVTLNPFVHEYLGELRCIFVPSSYEFRSGSAVTHPVTQVWLEGAWRVDAQMFFDAVFPLQSGESGINTYVLRCMDNPCSALNGPTGVLDFAGAATNGALQDTLNREVSGLDYDLDWVGGPNDRQGPNGNLHCRRATIPNRGAALFCGLGFRFNGVPHALLIQDYSRSIEQARTNIEAMYVALTRGPVGHLIDGGPVVATR